MISVSVIIPAFNRSKLLKKSIESVLAQTFTNYEIIVVDDCSVDDTQQVVSEIKDSRIRYIKTEVNSGGSLIPRQIGLSHSVGKYIAVLDDDDYWYDKSKLELQVAYLESHPECVLIGTDAVALNINNQIIARHHYPKTFSDIKDRMLAQNCFFHSSVVYRKEIYLKIGGYIPIKDGHYTKFANEYDLWLKMGLVGELINLPIYGVGYIYLDKGIKTNDHFDFMNKHLKTIGEYKKYYPNYLKAYLLNVAITVFELPVLIPFKRVIRKY